jgi:hypothetical protein
MKIYEHGRLVGLDALDSAAIRIKADGFFCKTVGVLRERHT